MIGNWTGRAPSAPPPSAEALSAALRGRRWAREAGPGEVDPSSVHGSVCTRAKLAGAHEPPFAGGFSAAFPRRGVVARTASSLSEGRAMRRMAPLLLLVAHFALASSVVVGAEFHVATSGNDAHPGNRVRPFRTIQRAADLAQPGDVVTVHAGVYRERVNPPRGGDSDQKRIVYRAAPGETVEIKGSVVVKGWVQIREGVWQVSLPNARFGRFNPYTNVIRGDWFGPRGRLHHTGAVYLNGDWLIEAPRIEYLLSPTSERVQAGPASLAGVGSGAISNALWYAQVDETNTSIWAQFAGADPNREQVEINVRSCVFYPEHPGRNFITVRGFRLRQAATPWAPPTAEQIALIGTHWSRGWIIESNEISHSVCAGLSLGKHGDAFDNTSANSAEGYVETIERAYLQPIPWKRNQIGHHLVRGNTISHCEQAGIVGSLGAAFSTVTDNVVHDIHVRRLFTGAEMAGIKFHGAIDTTIARNRLYRCCQGLWLDWMSQGTRVSGNLFYDNPDRDVFMEVNHGPYLIDNNLFLSRVSLLDLSQGGAYAHNLFAGKIISRPELKRETPFHPPHSTAIAGLSRIEGGENRFFHNWFVGDGSSLEPGGEQLDPKTAGGFGLWVYDFRPAPLQTGGNVYSRGARPYSNETEAVVVPGADQTLVWESREGRESVLIRLPAWTNRAGFAPVTSALLGRAKRSDCAYEAPDGSPLQVDADYFGRRRESANPTPGPFADLKGEPIRIHIP